MNKCSICGNPAQFSKAHIRNTRGDSAVIFEGLEVYGCAHCESSWVKQAPSAEELAEYYDKHYGIALKKDKRIDIPLRWDSRPASLIMMARLFSTFSPGDIFMDIGPGYGDALRLAAHLLPSPKLACIEFNQELIRFYRSVLPQVFAKDSTAAVLKRFGERSVKYVYAAHSLEHFSIAGLEEELDDIHRLMADDGAFIIEVPHVPVGSFKKAKNHTPHLIFFSRPGLVGLLERNGFEIALCVEVLGKNGLGKRYAETLKNDNPESLDPLLSAMLSAANAGDWIAARDNAKTGRILKCIARKATR